MILKFDNISYELNRSNSVEFLIDYEVSNYDMGGPCVDMSENNRRSHIRKQTKRLDLKTISTILKDLIINEEVSIESLVLKKVILRHVKKKRIPESLNVLFLTLIEDYSRYMDSSDADMNNNWLVFENSFNTMLDYAISQEDMKRLIFKKLEKYI